MQGEAIELSALLTSQSLAGVVAISEDGFGEIFLSQLTTGFVWRLQ